jgi:hypothetical protein
MDSPSRYIYGMQCALLDVLVIECSILLIIFLMEDRSALILQPMSALMKLQGGVG